MASATPAQIRKLLARRDAAAAVVAQLDREIAAANTAYSFEHGYRVTLRVETLRQAVAI